MNKMPPRKFTRAFTLIELLVTITIIAILASLAMVGIKSGIASADMVKATNCLRGLGAANFAYASENNGSYVPVKSNSADGATSYEWKSNPNFLRHYLDSSQFKENGSLKPELDKKYLDPVAVKANTPRSGLIGASFTINDVPFINSSGVGWNDPGFESGIRSPLVATPAQTAMFITSTHWTDAYQNRLAWLNDQTEGVGNKIAYRHKGKALVVYYDGHVGAITPQQVQEFDTEGENRNPFWGKK